MGRKGNGAIHASSILLTTAARERRATRSGLRRFSSEDISPPRDWKDVFYFQKNIVLVSRLTCPGESVAAEARMLEKVGPGQSMVTLTPEPPDSNLRDSK